MDIADVHREVAVTSVTHPHLFHYNKHIIVALKTVCLIHLEREYDYSQHLDKWSDHLKVCFN